MTLKPGEKFKIGEHKSKQYMEQIPKIFSGSRKENTKKIRAFWPLPEIPLNNFEDQEEIRKLNYNKIQRVCNGKVEIICKRG